VRFCLPIAHETSGASQHPAFPAPSEFWGLKQMQSSGAIRREIAKSCLYPRHCERSEAIHLRRAKEEWIASLRSQ
jgi:hypothetical protein